MPGFMTVKTEVRTTGPSGAVTDHPCAEDLYPMEWERFSSLTFNPHLELQTAVGVYRVELTIRAVIEPPAQLMEPGE